MQILQILNIISFLLPLFWLVVILFGWFKNNEINIRFIKFGIISVLAINFLLSAYLTIATYDVWKNDPVSRYLLPQYSGNYFYGYAYFHFWREMVVNIVIGIIWAGFLYLIKKYSNKRVLDKKDILLGFFTAMIVGWPKVFAYLALMFGLLALKSISQIMVYKRSNRVALTSSMALGALIAAGFGNFIMHIGFFDNIRL